MHIFFQAYCSRIWITINLLFKWCIFSRRHSLNCEIRPIFCKKALFPNSLYIIIKIGQRVKENLNPTMFFNSDQEVEFLAFLITCRLSSVCKLSTFSSSSLEPLGQFQPNLAQSILGWRRFKFVQMKGPALFQGEIITK